MVHPSTGSPLTSSRGPDEQHADLLGRNRSRRAGSTLLKTFNARIEIANDILQLLELILDETHLDCGLRSFVGKYENSRAKACWQLVYELFECTGKRRRQRRRNARTCVDGEGKKG